MCPSFGDAKRWSPRLVNRETSASCQSLLERQRALFRNNFIIRRLRVIDTAAAVTEAAIPQGAECPIEEPTPVREREN
jgi:hypothetical protein